MSNTDGDKIKILFLYPNEFLGPEMTVYRQIIRNLDRRRFAAYLVLNRDAQGEAGLSAADGVTIVRWKFGTGLRGGLGRALRSGVHLPGSMLRLVRYARLVGRENVLAGTDCGLGERVGHPSLVWAKFQAMAEGARLATRELWG